MPDYLFVDRPDDICQKISGYDQLGVDTEFMREKTYFAQLCLVQISTPHGIYCVDPLVDGDHSKFWTQLFGVRWIAHSARQDIEVVYQTAGAMPREIFDTQVAAGLVGLAAQIGYAGLVKELFDIEMAKSHTRADWTRRPLSDAVLDYAAEDVEHLLSAAEILSERLDKKGRLEWARQDSELLLDKTLYDISGQQAVERLKGARNLRGPKRAAAVRLAAWREEEAIRRNRPRQWILRDSALMGVANQLPETVHRLSAIDGFSPKVVSRIGKHIVDIVAASKDDSSCYQPPRPPDEAQKSLLKAMQARVAECANDLELAAETVASKRELSAIVVTDARTSRVFQGWRRDLIGEQLLQLL